MTRQKTLCLLCGAINAEFDPECGHADAQTPVPDARHDANGEPRGEASVNSSTGEADG